MALLLTVCVLISLHTVLAISTTSPIRGCPHPSFTPHVAPDADAADLKVLVPNILTMHQWVDCSDPTHVHGFSIDVFEQALSILPPNLSNMSIHYTCFAFPRATNSTGPTYDDMIDFVANRTYNAVVGDVTIAARRLSKVDFTQHYIESGVVLLTRGEYRQVSPWLFFGQPFSFGMWCTVVGAVAATGFLLCFFELHHHPEFTRGHILQRTDKIFWFMMETLILLEKESVKSTVSRLVMAAWVFFVILLGISYTAGLSSFLTANSLSPPTEDIYSLRASGKPLGYRKGSVVKGFLMTRFQVPETQLKPIRNLSDFVSNITAGPDEGGVIAIVDELPYVNFLLSNLQSSSCDFTITGPQLTTEGFGFGFRKDSNLASVFSMAISNLSESGCLQEMQDRFKLGRSSTCLTSNSFSTQVIQKSSLALFISFVGALSLCISVHFVKQIWRTRSVQRPNVIDDEFTKYMCYDSNDRQQHQEVELIRSLTNNAP